MKGMFGGTVESTFLKGTEYDSDFMNILPPGFFLYSHCNSASYEMCHLTMPIHNHSLWAIHPPFTPV